MARGVIPLSALAGRADSSSSQTTIMPDSKAAANQISKTFAFQSYHDTTLLWKAILEQNNNQPIVQSTVEQQQVSGYAIGNHPDSETPVAVVFSGDGRPSGSAVHIIPPGSIVRPAKGVLGEDGFQSFSWGLPYGWLGGGTATIVVFQTPDAWAEWSPRNEVLFHRFRAQIVAPSAITSTLTDWPRNWPTRFPNFVMRRGNATVVTQQGAPQIAISKPGRVVFSLRTTLASASSMKALFYHTTDFSDEITATPATVPFDSVEFTVPARSAYVYGANTVEYTLFDAPDIMSRLGCNGLSSYQIAGVQFVSDDPNLQSQYIDVCRYGYL